MKIIDLGILDFSQAYALQQNIKDKIAAGSEPETLLLVEHPPVYTLGRNGHLDNVLSKDVEVIDTNRGGDITFHTFGQLVGYPLLNLTRLGKDLRLYLRFLEEVLIRVAADFGVSSYRRTGKTGVWTDEGKLASIGVGARRWITMHGFALNVSTDLSGFKLIHPCGISGCPMTSLTKICPQGVSMNQVKNSVIRHFERLFELWVSGEVEWQLVNECSQNFADHFAVIHHN